MNKTDDILERLKGQQPMIDDPDALTDRIMNSLPDLEPYSQEDEGKARIITIKRRWMAAAASILLIIGIGTMVWQKEPGDGSEANTYVAQNVETSPKPVSSLSPSTETASTETASTKKTSTAQPSSTQVNSPSPANTEQPKTDERPAPPIESQSSLADNHIHYAAVMTTDEVPYQDPARVDEFIAKLADFNDVNPVSLDCSPGNNDNITVSRAYTFDDTMELDLFGRLLQVACCYDSKTPGYLLKFSNEQLFFTLKDMRKGKKYFWMAERISGDRILLTCTRSPIDVVPSTACYQAYRNKMKQPMINNTLPKDI